MQNITKANDADTDLHCITYFRCEYQMKTRTPMDRYTDKLKDIYQPSWSEEMIRHLPCKIESTRKDHDLCEL